MATRELREEAVAAQLRGSRSAERRQWQTAGGWRLGLLWTGRRAELKLARGSGKIGAREGNAHAGISGGSAMANDGGAAKMPTGIHGKEKGKVT
nr:unnamed protein product [Digitaria exilis]